MAVWSGWTGATQQQKIDRLTALQAAAGRKIDVLGHMYGGGGTLGGAASCADVAVEDVSMSWAIQNGSVPYLSWTPGRSGVNGDSVVRQIINGQRDGCLDTMAAHLDAKGVRIMLRPLHEFNFMQYFRRSDGSLDYTTDATQAHAIVDAWRRIVGRFQAAGAERVGFAWCPDESEPRDMVALAYPGNSYVDWVCSDRYNYANSSHSSCIGSGWVSFDDIFNYTGRCGDPAIERNRSFYDRFAVANGKPFFVGETSTRYDSSQPDRKNQWYADIRRTKDPTDAARYMPNLISVIVFDQFAAGENNSDWRIDSYQTASMASAGQLGTQAAAHGLNGWVQWAQDPRWNVGVRP